MKDYIRLIKYTKPHLRVLIPASVFMVFSQLFQPVSLVALIPFINRVLMGDKITLPNTNLPPQLYQLTDKINSMPQLKLLGFFIIFYLVTFLIRSVFLYLQNYLMREASQRIVKDIRDGIYKKLLNLSMKFYSGSKTGTLISRITFDSTVVQDAVSEGLTDLISQTALFVFSASTLVIIVWIYKIPIGLLLVSFFLPPLIIAPVVRIGKRLKQISQRTQEAMADINNVLYETISGIRIVKAFSMERYEYNKFKNKSLSYKKTIMKSNKRILAISPLTEFIGAIGGLTVIWFGGKEVIAGNVALGVLLPFLLCLMSLVKPLNRLSRVHSVNQKSLAAASRIFEILDTPQDVKETQHPIELPDISGKIEFKNIDFSYDGKPVLKNINLTAKSGQIIALVGPSGVGKTTLVNLLPRFYDPQQGSVSIDGHDLKGVTLDSLRAQIGIVTQDTILFNDTVYSNISYGNKSTNMDDVISAAKTANAHDFIMKMPDKYQTIIGERGFRVSGGEKQRLAIARAILKNPPILIFDEATSQLDSHSEILVQDAIDKLMSGRTVFVIAHRISTIKHATQIVVMDKGAIKNVGTHDELMKKEGLYSALYNMQFRGL